MDTFDSQYRYYRSQHRTVGCKLTHMFGIPMIAVSIPMLFLHWQVAIALFVVGWALQFLGHFVFEHNSPVLFSDPKDPWTYIVALVFCADEWKALFTGKLWSGREMDSAAD